VTAVRGVIGSEKQPFFNDPEVNKVFRSNGLDVKVDTAGSRQIATSFDLKNYDFAFPAGVPAAEKIKRDRKINTSYQPFYTPTAGCCGCNRHRHRAGSLCHRRRQRYDRYYRQLSDSPEG
jgi:hypothetical protein